MLNLFHFVHSSSKDTYSFAANVLYIVVHSASFVFCNIHNMIVLQLEFC